MLDKLRTHMKEALKAGEKERLSTIRMLLASLKNEQIAKMGELEEEEILAVFQRELKRRLEAAEQYRKGDREELAAKEEREADIIRAYLPAPLSEEELEKVVTDSLQALNVTSMKEMGKVMKEIMGKYRGRVDGKQVQAVVSRLLR